MHNSHQASFVGWEELREVVDLLRGQPVTLYECSYDYLAFGSWVVICGTAHRRIRIARDGKDTLVRFDTSTFARSGAKAHWEEVRSAPLGILNDNTLGEYIERLIVVRPN